MALDLTGKVLLVLPEQSGTGRNGPWTRQDFIVETLEQYPRKVCFSAWNDKVTQVKNIRPDDKVKVFFNVESREFNGKWYTDLRIWKLEGAGESAPQTGDSISSAPPADDLQPLIEGGEEEEKDDLPF